MSADTLYNIIGLDKGFEKCDFCNSQNWVTASREYPNPLRASASVIKFNCQNAEAGWVQPSRHASYLLSAELLRDRLKVVESITSDPVSHPAHYTSHPSGIECIDITRHHNFDIGNAIKYLWRNGLKDKDSQIEDLEKAVWYIQDEIKRLKNATTDS